MMRVKIDTTYLTDTQIMRKVIALTKQWLKERGLNDIQFEFIRGCYYFTNVQSHLLTAQYILQEATGLRFAEMSFSVAKRIKDIDETEKEQTYFQNLNEYHL